MPIICWGNLAKSADDVQKIEEGMQEYVERHNENPNAHQVEGSSLYMHRANEIMDHPAGSVDLRHLSEDKIIVFTAFESIDGWNKVGNASTLLCEAHIYTDAVADSVSRLAIYDSSLNNLLNFSKDLFFQTTVYFHDLEYNDCFFGFGCYGADFGYDSFGFKVEDADVKAYWTKNNVAYSSLLSGIDIDQRNVYRAYNDLEAGKIYFYVNGVLKYTAEANLPVVTNAYVFSYYLQTLDDVALHMYMADLYFEIGR